MNQIKVIVTGSKGQLGYELQRCAPAHYQLLGLDLPELDVTDSAAVQRAVLGYQPHLIINAAAYTAVDKAESDQEVAFKVNRDAASDLATLAKTIGARLLHVSTDFVFNGLAGRPYQPHDPISPLSVYGASKAAGDAAVLANHPANSLVVRTAWVYSAHGGNFVKSILKLLRERDKLTIIADQIGTPTWAASLARCLWTFADRSETGIWHYTDAGTASWYDFAQAIAEEGLTLGLIPELKPVLPIRTADYPTPAKRPSFSVLDKTSTWAVTGIPGHWRSQLRQMMGELKQSGF